MVLTRDPLSLQHATSQQKVWNTDKTKTSNHHISKTFIQMHRKTSGLVFDPWLAHSARVLIGVVGA
jgi:hypothetical protein